MDDVGPLLTPREVASLFRVDPKTVTRWAAAGRISSIRTLGGHRRFKESEVQALLGRPSETSPSRSWAPPAAGQSDRPVNDDGPVAA